jgi:F0F1-type ATP synthase assembly protein I
MPDENSPLPSDDDIQSRFDAIKEKLTVDLDDVDERLNGILQGTETGGLPVEEEDEMQAKARELEQKALALKAKREAQVAEQTRQTRATQESTQGLGAGLMVAYALIGIPLAGGLVGLGLKSMTGNPIWVSVFGLGGMILGVYGAYIMSKRTGQ